MIGEVLETVSGVMADTSVSAVLDDLNPIIGMDANGFH